MAATLLALFIACAPAFAQPTAADKLPNSDDVQAAFATLRDWVSAFETPRMNDDSSRVPIEGATGVCMVLRRSGRVLGIGTDNTGDALMLRRAARNALNDVLSDPVLSALSADLLKQQQENPEHALTIDALRAQVGAKLTIELEVAGQLTPLIGRSLEQLARKLEPVIDGVALRQGQNIEYTFPSHLRASNAAAAGDPAKLLLNLAIKAGIAIKDIDELARREDLGLYSFRTITLAQNAPDESPRQTLRGDVVVPQEAVNRESIAALADGLAKHLIASLWPQTDDSGPEPVERVQVGIRGDYSVVADQYRPLFAPPLDQALAALALNRYANAGEHGADRAIVAHAVDAAATILRDLSIVTSVEDDPRRDLAACAAIVHAMLEGPWTLKDSTVAALFAEARSRVMQSFEPGSGFLNRLDPAQRARTVPAPVQAMLAGALSRLLSQPDVESRPKDEFVRQAIDEAWKSAPPAQHVALLPWIGWAEADYVAATNQPLAHADDLRLLLEALHESRIGSATHPATATNADLIGGFALTGESLAAPTATAQTVRPGAWLATALTNPALVENDKAAEYVAGHLRTMRFLMQLSVRSDNLGAVRNPGRALGGLRNAPWDSDQPVPAQALGLMTAADTLTYFRELP